MLFVIVGVLIIAANLAGFGPFAAWTWEITGDLWRFCVPFVFAVIWWWWADTSGWTKRREMEKMEDRRKERRVQNLDNLGMDEKGRRGKSGSAKHARNHRI